MPPKTYKTHNSYHDYTNLLAGAVGCDLKMIGISNILLTFGSNPRTVGYYSIALGLDAAGVQMIRSIPEVKRIKEPSLLKAKIEGNLRTELVF